MQRRDFLKLGVLAGGSVIAAEWIFDTAIADAKSLEFASTNGFLKIQLVAEEKLISYGNSTRWAMTYNGVFPAPTLRINPGDIVEVKLINKLSQPTNLHTHGLHTSPSGNGDNPLIMIEPGQSFNYSFKIPKTQKSGTFWYHPHHHELSAGQVSSGLAGAIIVEDQLDSTSLITNSIEQILILADPRIGKTSSVANTSQMDLMHGRTGPNTLVNGILLPKFDVLSGAVERLRIINSCVSQYQTISIPGAQMWQISSDSSRLPKPEKTTSVTLTPGQRVEILVAAPKVGTFVLKNEFQSLAKLAFKTKTRDVKPASLLTFTPITKVDRKRTITVTGSGMGMMGATNHEAAFTFDGKPFDPKRIDQSVKFGSVEEWTISNPSSMDHPFHLHVWPFQVANDGHGKTLQGWHDTVNLPSGGSVRIRIPFVDIKGTTVYHCHILDHEDAGMMGIIKVS